MGNKQGDTASAEKAEVDWLLPGCTLEKMRARADGFVPFWKKTDGRLLAKVRNDQLTVRIIRLRRYERSVTVKAHLTRENDGVRVRGQIAGAGLLTLIMWFGMLALLAGMAVVSAIQRSAADPRTLGLLLVAAVLAVGSRGVVSGRKAGYEAELAELEGKVRTRFAGGPTPGAPWIAEPAPGTGYQPFKPQPMIRFGRGRTRRPGRTR